MSAEHVLVSWVSFNNDPYERERSTGAYRGPPGAPIPGPSLELLTNPHSPYRGKVGRAYFLVRRGDDEQGTPRPVDGTEVAVYDRLHEALAGHPDGRGIAVETRFWDTCEPPTAYRPLFEFTVAQLREIRRRHPKAKIVINLSPGTPQMQTVMLLAVQARFAGEPVEIVQGIPAHKRRPAGRILEPVPWNLLGELNAMEAASDGTVPTVVWSIDQARSEPLRTVAAEINRLGRLSYPVLILGARGTGKTRIAERLRARFLEQRNRGGRDAAWDFRLNCAALQGPLLESELFGHARGAFTGADRDKPGLLEVASGDCVFLDEIHHLSDDTQSRLLVALERRGRFHRVGDPKPREASFRLIAASNRSRDELRQILAPDFYDRIADFIVEVPDLRRCADDIDGIWDHVVRETSAELAASLNLGDRHARLFHAEITRHDELIRRQLRGMSLHGNWRDLQRLSRRLVARGLAPGVIPTFSLPPADVQKALDGLAREEVPPDATEGGTSSLLQSLPSLHHCLAAVHEATQDGHPIPMRKLLEELERRILTAAKQTAGSGRKAADLVNMPVRTFNDRYQALSESTSSAGGHSKGKGRKSPT